MRLSSNMLGLVGLVALGGCNAVDQGTNVSTTVETDNGAVVAPGGEAENGAAANATAASAPVLSLASDGLMLVTGEGSSRHARFGMDRETAVRMVSAAVGSSTGQGLNNECGAGPLEMVDFTSGLTLFFQQGKFVGWDLDGRDGGKYATMAGIGLGSTRAQLEAVGPVEVSDTSIGHEFAAGELYGLLDATAPTGKVTNLWAGTTCIFR